MDKIYEFVRDPRTNQLRGCVMAAKHGEAVGLGWSYTNVKAGDRFDKAKALTIAEGRCKTGTVAVMPRHMIPVYDKMIKRASRYFKMPLFKTL
jgi:hypothetical protein